MKDIAPGHIHRVSFGTGRRDVLAVHCTLAHSGAWKGLHRALGDAVTLHAFDMPSHGRSADWDPARGTFPDQVTEAALGVLSRPMDVIGHSFGALVALRLAAEQPALVRSLTLIEPVFFAVALQDAPDVVEAHAALTRPVFEALETGDTALAARLFNRMWSDGPRWPDLPEATRAAMTRAIPVVPGSHPAVFEDTPGLLAPGVLAGLSCPVLLLRGAKTDPVIACVNDGLARRIPGARNIVVPGAGHMLPISHPAETAVHVQAVFQSARG